VAESGGRVGHRCQADDQPFYSEMTTASQAETSVTDLSATTEAKDLTKDLALIVGVIATAAFVVLFVCLIAAFAFWRRRKYSANNGEINE